MVLEAELKKPGSQCVYTHTFHNFTEINRAELFFKEVTATKWDFKLIIKNNKLYLQSNLC